MSSRCRYAAGASVWLPLLDGLGSNLDDLLGRVEGEGGEQVTLALGEFGGLAERAGGSGEGDDVEPVEFGTDGGPGAPGGGLRDAHEEQGEPAQQDVGADAVFEVW